MFINEEMNSNVEGEKISGAPSEERFSRQSSSLETPRPELAQPESFRSLSTNEKLKMICNRVFHWNLKTIRLTNNEHEAMDDKDISEDKLVRIYMAWRKTIIETLLPVSVISAIFKVTAFLGQINSLMEIKERFFGEQDQVIVSWSVLGWIALVSKSLLPDIIMMSGAVICYRNRLEFRYSLRVLLCTVALAQLFSLWPTFIQVDKLITIDYGDLEKHSENLRNTIRLMTVFNNVMDLAPIIIVISRGASQAGLCMFSLISGSPIPGILVLFFAPFATTILLIAGASAGQLFGDAFFVFGLLFLFLGDMVIYFAADVLLKGRPEKMKRYLSVQSVLTTIGIMLLIAWMIFKAVNCLTIPVADGSTFAVAAETAKKPYCAAAVTLVGTDFSNIIVFVTNVLRELCLSKLIFSDMIRYVITFCEKRSEFQGFVNFFKSENIASNDDVNPGLSSVHVQPSAPPYCLEASVFPVAVSQSEICVATAVLCEDDVVVTACAPPKREIYS